MLTSLAYDGLVAYRRADGVAAGPSWARSRRAPAAQPRRPHLRVHAPRGAAVFRRHRRFRPGISARRWSGSCASRVTLPTALRRHRGRAALYAKACPLRPVAWDRVGSDDRTITIHLTAPDADFLDNLTLPFAFVVPAGTPATASRNLAPPGTGPYRIAAWDARRGGRLVRNPRFRPTAARPAGFADRIEFTRTTSATARRALAAVERGKTDVCSSPRRWTAC